MLHLDEIVPVDIEIWPTSIVFQAGHRLVLEIAAQDSPGSHLVLDDPRDRPLSRFAGQNTLYTGGAQQPFLLLPIIPGRWSKIKE